MKLIVSQNVPFHPIYDAWNAGSGDILPLDNQLARQKAEMVDAKVLSNRKPPYAPAGGLYDALKDSGGDVMIAGNQQAEVAARLFEETEGTDIHPAAAVATATLIEAIQQGKVSKESVVMLNITGGGEQRFKKEHELFYLKPSEIFPVDIDPGEIRKRISQLF
jgi:cysteate synthase